MAEQDWIIREQRREGRFSTAWYIVGAGLAVVGVGLVVGADGVDADGAGGWAARTAGGVENLSNGSLALGVAILALGVLMALFNWPGAAAKRLAEHAPGRAERVHKDRSSMLVIVPLTMLFFASRAVPGVGRMVDGTADFGDKLFLAVALLYAWLGPLIVMGWDGGSRRNRKYLEDELSRHIRARSIISAFFVLLAGTSGALALALFNPVWAVQTLPLALAGAGATAALRFAWLDHQAGRDDG